MSQGTRRTVADTVVLRYFLLVERTDLLRALLASPIIVPRIVFDPEEGDVPFGAMSEMTRSIAFQRRVSRDPQAVEEEREQAAMRADRLEGIHTLLREGHMEVTDLAGPERDRFARLTDRRHAPEFGLRFGLDPGEAACVAIALERRFVLATDDDDALKALRSVRKRHLYQRIRKMLIEAAELGLVTEPEANDVHQEMRLMGFWDKSRPFPKLGT